MIKKVISRETGNVVDYFLSENIEKEKLKYKQFNISKGNIIIPESEAYIIECRNRCVYYLKLYRNSGQFCHKQMYLKYKISMSY